MKTVIGDVYKNTCSCGHRLWINSKAAVFSLSIIVTIALCAIPKSFLSFLLLCCCWTWRNHIPLAVAVHAAHMNLFCVLPKNMWSQCLTFRFYRCSVWVGSFCCHSSDWLVLFALFSLPGLFFFPFQQLKQSYCFIVGFLKELENNAVTLKSHFYLAPVSMRLAGQKYGPRTKAGLPSVQLGLLDSFEIFSCILNWKALCCKLRMDHNMRMVVQIGNFNFARGLLSLSVL